MDVVSLGETMVLFTPEGKGLMRYGGTFSSRIAGAETNTLIGLTRLGHEAGWISRVGKDEFGMAILSSIRGEGVDVEFVKKDSGAPTGVFFKEPVNEAFTRVYYYRKNSAASRLDKDDISENYISKAKYLYLTGITPALSDSCKKAVFHSIELARKNGVKVVFDPNLRKKLWTEAEAMQTLLSIAEKADIILSGIGEGEFLFESSGHEEIAAGFLGLGASLVVVKLGAAGAYIATRTKKAVIPGFKVERVIDPVGAGDGFAAGFLSGLLDGLVVDEAVKRANAVGAMVTMVNGDIEGLPDRELLEGFLGSGEDVAR